MECMRELSIEIEEYIMHMKAMFPRGNPYLLPKSGHLRVYTSLVRETMKCLTKFSRPAPSTRQLTFLGGEGAGRV